MINLIFRRTLPTTSVDVNSLVLRCWRFYSSKNGALNNLRKQQQKLINNKKTYSNEAGNQDALNRELALKIAENKQKNVLVYTCNVNGLGINIIGCIGGMLLLAASYSTWHLFSSIRFKERKLDQESGFFLEITKMIGTDYFKVALCSVITIVGIFTLDFNISSLLNPNMNLLYTTRMVNKLYLLKGGQKIGVITEGLLGYKMNYVLNLSETTFSSTRKSRTAFVYFKNRKRYFHFLMVNNDDGKYHDKLLFDHVICMRR